MDLLLHKRGYVGITALGLLPTLPLRHHAASYLYFYIPY